MSGGFASLSLPKMTKSQFLIGAPSSDSGKTTLTLALLRLFADRGQKVQPFKCGPDYLDPIHHTRAARRPSVNLDLFMMSPAHVQALFARHTATADVAIAEGMMGLFDGVDKAEGSSAAIASLLGLPVLLVVDGRAMAYSAAPLLAGFRQFRPDVKIAGVIFNFVNSDRHYQILRAAAADAGVEALGYVPRNEAMGLPERHLGLAVSPEHDYETIIARAAAHVSQTVDIDRLLALTVGPAHTPPPSAPRATGRRQRIAVARDEVFNFTYHENLRALADLGEVVEFSPLRDAAPPAADLIYLAGGYPELFLEQLAANESMRHALQAYASGGGRIFAECGGLMYLGQHIIDAAGKRHPMAGVLPVETSMQTRRLTLGYRCVDWAGRTFRGHEFHYSTLTESAPLTSFATVTDARRRAVPTKVYRQGGVFASYVHFYWGEECALLAE